MITAQVNGETSILNDEREIDNDTDTIYKFPIDGFVIGVEIYCTSERDSRRETFTGIKTSYDVNTKQSYVFLTYDDYRLIYSRGPNNKLKIYSLIIE